LHKLAVTGQRPESERTKSAKGRNQALQILEVLVTAPPGILDLALESPADLSDGWARLVARSAKQASGLSERVLERLETSAARTKDSTRKIWSWYYRDAQHRRILFWAQTRGSRLLLRPESSEA